MSTNQDARRKIIQTRDLIFPTAATVSVHSQLASIKRATLSISNRLHSIQRDADFVRWVAAHYGRTSTAPSHYGGYDGDDFDVSASPVAKQHCLLPVIANERCGSWYIPPNEKTGGSSYWKSTDGHWGVWAFSLRRLNVGVLDVLVASGGRGAVVVDSTRQGKQLPDSFSKTVPIWCAVLNRLLFPEPEWAAYHGFERCEAVVSASEVAQIKAKLPSLVDAVRELGLDVEGLRKKMGKPVKCFWIARGLGLIPPTPAELATQFEGYREGPDSSLKFHPLYLCMASEYQESATESSYSGYVQGAGDDAEAWASGLTPELFWKYRQRLINDNIAEGDYPSLIESLVREDMQQQSGTGTAFRETCNLADGHLVIGQLSEEALEISGFCQQDIAILCCSSKMSKGSTEKRVLQLGCAQGKRGSRDLRIELEKVGPFLANSKDIRRVYVCCNTGRDLSIGVALVLMCLHLDDSMCFTSPSLSHMSSNITDTAKMATSPRLLHVSKNQSWTRP